MLSGLGDGRAWYSRPLLVAFILLCHALLILLAPRGLIHVPHSVTAPMLLFTVPPPPPPTPPTALPRNLAAIAKRRVAITAALAAKARAVERMPDAVPARPPKGIDWSAQAASAAQHQIDLAAAPVPRSLDDHHASQPRAGLNSGGPYQFGWDYAATHRVDATQGVPVIHLSDRCAVAFLLILPNFACGFGAKIPVDGDLFKHMHDSP